MSLADWLMIVLALASVFLLLKLSWPKGKLTPKDEAKLREFAIRTARDAYLDARKRHLPSRELGEKWRALVADGLKPGPSRWRGAR